MRYISLTPTVLIRSLPPTQSGATFLNDLANIQIRGRPLRHWASLCKIEDLSVLEGNRNHIHLLLSMIDIGKGRSIEQGQAGRVYLVPDMVRDHDLICVLSGCAMPMVLRRCQEYYTVIGSCYADGVMHGEAMREHLTHSSLEEFDLI